MHWEILSQMMGSDIMKWTSKETLGYVYPLLEKVLKRSAKSFNFEY